MTNQPKETGMGSRQLKSARVRAEETLGVAERRVAKLTRARDAALDALRVIETDLAEAEKRRTYVQGDPALPKSVVKSVSS